jgi:hypothetical protein
VRASEREKERERKRKTLKYVGDAFNPSTVLFKFSPPIKVGGENACRPESPLVWMRLTGDHFN